MGGNGVRKGQQVSVARVNLGLQKIERDFSGIVALVVGHETGDGKKQLPPPKIAHTFVDLGYIPEDYLFNVPSPHNDTTLSKFSKGQIYLMEWVKRACEYANPPTPENIGIFLSVLGEISREAVSLGLEKGAGFDLGHPYVARGVEDKVVRQGLWMIRKKVEAPRLLGDLEVEISRQAALIEAVVQSFGGTIRRIAQGDLYKTINSLRGAFITGNTVLGLEGKEEGKIAVATTYKRLTAQLGDPLPFNRLPHPRV
ncbi:hypothetical protein HYU20_01775 [Candidatus Woesearchaeota archaeon]|nr:hypothetical protein [Candidatus Woesearchaeota archaeon]